MIKEKSVSPRCGPERLKKCAQSHVPHACLTANTREQASYTTTMSVVKTVKGRKALLTALEQVGWGVSTWEKDGKLLCFDEE